MFFELGEFKRVSSSYEPCWDRIFWGMKELGDKNPLKR